MGDKYLFYVLETIWEKSSPKNKVLMLVASTIILIGLISVLDFIGF